MIDYTFGTQVLTMCVLPFAVYLLYWFPVSLGGENVTVTTSKGIVVGVRLNPNPATSASYDAFLGIPYGLVQARFQPSVSRDNWSSPLVAQADGPMCPQPDQSYSEDCLYLNVFTPVNASQNFSKYPVMAYIHGGGCTSGSSSSLQYGPDFLVPQGVVLVTMNYRLGAAGFLTLGTSEAPGNLGLYDTMLALQWVQQEIGAFGGDPTQVTLFGHSAGSVLVLSHYISPLSSGLFMYTIGQSGPALTDGHIMSADDAVLRAKVLARAVGCDSSALNDSALLTCLQKVDITTLVAKQSIPLPVKDIASGKTIRWKPVMDLLFAESPFFPGSLNKLLEEAAKRSKPLVTGFASADGIVKFQDTEDVWRLAEANLDSFIPWRFQESLNDNTKSIMIKKIREKYFPETAEENKVIDLVNLYTDTIFSYPSVKMSRLLANCTYGYVYNYQGVWNPMPSYFSQFRVTGVFHGAELTYLFYTANSSQDLGQCSLNLPCIAMRDTLVRLWTTFAKTGLPDPSSSWATVSKGQYLVIDEPLSFINTSDLEERYYQFWVNLSSDNNSSVNVVGNLMVVVIALWVLLSIGV